MVLRACIDSRTRIIDWNGNPGCDQISLFWLSIAGVVKLGCLNLEVIQFPRRNGHHRKIGVANTGPIHRSWNHQVIGAVLVFIDSLGLVPLNLFTDRSYCLGRNGIERIMFDTLIPDARSESESCFGNNLTTSLYRDLKVCYVAVCIKNQGLYDIQTSSYITKQKCDLPL